MTTTISSFVTIGCDAEGCPKTVTFAQTQQGEQEATQDNPWMNTMRFIQTIDGRKLGYCSDECEAKAVGTGVHNKLEPKKIITTGNQAQVELAAKAAAAAAKAQEALRQGTGIQVAQA